jgi:hypothetical protein
MATRYADVVDPQVIVETIPDDYQNKAQIIQSGLAMLDGDPAEGTQASWIKETLFEGDAAGQAIAMDGSVSLSDKAQVKYQVPLFYRADGALLQDIEGEITSKVKRDAALNISNSIERKSNQIVDTTMIKILEGCSYKLENANENFYDTSSSQISLDAIEACKATRGDQGDFDNGVIIVRGAVYHKLVRLGLVTWSNATMTNEYRQMVQSTGGLPQILGLQIFQTDKLALAGDGDYYCFIAEKGALKVKGRVKPDIDPLVRAERQFADIVKFKLKLGGGIVGMSWGGTASDLVTNTQLATYTNWSRAKTYAKDVPLCVLRIPVPA